MENLVPLAQYGVVGICVALVMFLAWVVKMFVDHSKQCRDDVVKVIQDNNTALTQLAKVIDGKL